MAVEGFVSLYDQFYFMHQYQGPRGRVGGCHSPNFIEISRLGKVPSCWLTKQGKIKLLGTKDEQKIQEFFFET